MSVLYISGSYESVQKHLVSSLQESGIGARMFYYDISHNFNVDNLTEDVFYYNPAYFMKGPPFYVSRIKRAADYFVKHNNLMEYSVFHGNMMFCDGIVCRRLSMVTGIPYVISVRDTDINSWFTWRWPWITNEGIKNLKYAKKIIFISKPYKEKLLNRINDVEVKRIVNRKSEIIPNGIDEYFINNVYKEKQCHKHVRIIYVGKFEKRKNFELTVKAVEILKNEGMDIGILAIGEIIDKEYYQIIEKTEYIKYHHKCDKEHILEYMRKADIFVMPSHRETFGLVYAEAMSQGVPVIYTRGQGFDMQFEEGVVGYSVSDKDHIELANKIKMVINNYDILSSNCVNLVKKFDWKSISKRLQEVYYD